MDDLISRQAAIETVMECYDNDELFEVYEDKLRELPPANCSEFPNSSDTISRQQATDTLRGYLVGKRCPDDGTLTCRLIENEVINKLPSAQPKKGRWISADAMFHGVPFYCSECGENTRDTVMGKPRWKFCPMCGAKMEVTE